MFEDCGVGVFIVEGCVCGGLVDFGEYFGVLVVGGGEYVVFVVYGSFKEGWIVG